MLLGWLFAEDFRKGTAATKELTERADKPADNCGDDTLVGP